LIYTTIAKTHILASVLNMLFMAGVMYIVVTLLIKEFARPRHINGEVIDKKVDVRGYSSVRGISSYRGVNVVVIRTEESKREEYTARDSLYSYITIGQSYKFFVKGSEIKEINEIEEVGH